MAGLKILGRGDRNIGYQCCQHQAILKTPTLLPWVPQRAQLSPGTFKATARISCLTSHIHLLVFLLVSCSCLQNGNIALLHCFILKFECAVKIPVTVTRAQRKELTEEMLIWAHNFGG